MPAFAIYYYDQSTNSPGTIPRSHNPSSTLIRQFLMRLGFVPCHFSRFTIDYQAFRQTHDTCSHTRSAIVNWCFHKGAVDLFLCLPIQTNPAIYIMYLLTRLKLLLCNRDSPVWFDHILELNLLETDKLCWSQELGPPTRDASYGIDTCCILLITMACMFAVWECSTFSQPWPCDQNCQSEWCITRIAPSMYAG